MEISKNFLEVILAKGFDKNSLKILQKKKNLRIIDISKYNSNNTQLVKNFGKSFLIQSKDKIILDSKKLKFVTKLKPTKKELVEIKFAYNISKHVKSNAIVLCNNFSTIGIGAGQPSRLDCCKLAIQKANIFSPKRLRTPLLHQTHFFHFQMEQSLNKS